MEEFRERKLAQDLERELLRQLQLAVVELRARDLPNTANALAMIRDYMFQWRDVAIMRLKELGVYSMTQDQYDHLMSIVASAMVREAIDETKRRQEEKTTRWLQSWQIRAGLVAVILSIVVTAITDLYGLFRGLAHPLLPGGLP